MEVEVEIIVDMGAATAAEVAMEFVATPYVSVHSGAAIVIEVAAMGHSVTYVFSFLA